MKRWACVALAAAFALGGCGDRNLILRVDVLSYFTPSQTRFAFGPLPPGAPVVRVPLVNDESINLLEGLDGVSEVRDVAFTLEAVFRDSTGSGGDTLAVYMSDEDTDPYTTPPVVVKPVVLSPGVTDTVVITLSGDRRVAELFQGQRMRISVVNTIVPPASGPALNGRLRLTALDAVVVMVRKDL
jgi:hypothetical protein